MIEKYVAITVERGQVEYDSNGNGVVFDDRSESFDVSDPSGSFSDLFDDVAFEARSSLDH